MKSLTTLLLFVLLAVQPPQGFDPIGPCPVAPALDLPCGGLPQADPQVEEEILACVTAYQAQIAALCHLRELALQAAYNAYLLTLEALTAELNECISTGGTSQECNAIVGPKITAANQAWVTESIEIELAHDAAVLAAKASADACLSNVKCDQ